MSKMGARVSARSSTRQSARAIIPNVISQLVSKKKYIEIGNIQSIRDFSFVIDQCNDLVKLINKKKICGILQEKINKSGNDYLIVGIGFNLIKSPIIPNYHTTNLFEITKKSACSYN